MRCSSNFFLRDSSDKNTVFNILPTNKGWFFFITSFWSNNSISKWKTRSVTSINSLLSTYQWNISSKVKSKFSAWVMISLWPIPIRPSLFSPILYWKLTFLKNNLPIYFIIKITCLIIDCIMKTFFSRDDYCPALIANFCCV